MNIRHIHRAVLLLVVWLASAGAGASQQTAAPANGAAGQKTRSYLFVSPNTRENLTLEEALRNLNSTEEFALMLDERLLACRLRLKAKIARAIGSWTDGAEHSTLLRIKTDEETARYADAWLGKRARQKSALYFQQRAGGTARMYVLTSASRRAPASLAQALDRNGITDRTLVPLARRTLIYIVDLKDELRQRIAATARQLRARYRVLNGTADFIGDSDRDKAQQVFGLLISKFEQGHLLRSNCTVKPARPSRLKRSAAFNRTLHTPVAYQF